MENDRPFDIFALSMVLAWASLERPDREVAAAYDASTFFARVVSDVATGCGFTSRGIDTIAAVYRHQDAESVDQAFGNSDETDPLAADAVVVVKRSHIVATVDDPENSNSFLLIDLGIVSSSAAADLDLDVEPVACVVPGCFLSGDSAVAIQDPERESCVRYTAKPRSRSFATSKDWRTEPGSARDRLRVSARDEFSKFLSTELRATFRRFRDAGGFTLRDLFDERMK